MKRDGEPAAICLWEERRGEETRGEETRGRGEESSLRNAQGVGVDARREEVLICGKG